MRLFQTDMSDNKPVIILGIESSCDDTSAAIIRDGLLLSNVIASQKVHEEYGGVVSVFEQFKNVHIKKMLKNDCDLRFLNELLDKATEAERNILSGV